MFGVNAMQLDGFVGAFDAMLERERPGRIIEIGSAWGGLSVVLGLYGTIHDIPVYLFDLLLPWEFENNSGVVLTEKACARLGLKLAKGDVFSGENKSTLTSLIVAKGKCLLLCDGGDKVSEFNQFAKYLKPGDIIMAHDYWHDREALKKYGCVVMEIEYGQVSETMNSEKLNPIYAKIMEPLSWLCTKKGR